MGTGDVSFIWTEWIDRFRSTHKSLGKINEHEVKYCEVMQIYMESDRA